MIQGEITKERMEGWKFDSSCEEGFHEIIAPGKADCEQEYIYRLNLSAGKSFDLETGKLEMDAVCIKGAADFSWDGYAGTCDKLDSFYVVSNMKVHITAKEDCIFYIAGAVDEGYGKPSDPWLRRQPERGIYDHRSRYSIFQTVSRSDLGRKWCMDQLAAS